MIFKNKKIAGLAAIAAVAIPAVAYSASTDVEVSAEFRTALVLATTDVAFGILEFSAAPGGGDTATIATDGSITYAGNFSGPSSGTAGSVQITGGQDGSTVSVRCETTATLEEPTGESIDFTTIQVREEGGGADSACVNLATSSATMVLDIGGGTADEFAFGGVLDGATASGGFIAAVYNTTTGTGDGFQVDVVYQ